VRLTSHHDKEHPAMGIHGGGWASQILIYQCIRIHVHFIFNETMVIDPWPLGVSNVWTNPKKQIQKESYLLCMVI